MIKAILFDWDRTLANTLIPKVRLARHLLKQYGVSQVKILRSIRQTYGLTTFQIIRKFGKEENYEDIIHSYETLYKEKYSKKVKFFDKSLLSDLKNKGYKIGIVTNDLKSNAIYTCAQLNQPYDIMISFEDVKHPKPHPEPVLKALKQLNIKPEEAIVVGDHPFDMLAAKAAGCTAVGIASILSPKTKLKSAGADHIIKNIKEIRNLL